MADDKVADEKTFNSQLTVNDENTFSSRSTVNDAGQEKTLAASDEKKTFDRLLIEHLGQFGRFQWFLFLSLALCAFAATIQNLVHVFTGAIPDFLCIQAGDWRIPDDDIMSYIQSSAGSMYSTPDAMLDMGVSLDSNNNQSLSQSESTGLPTMGNTTSLNTSDASVLFDQCVMFNPNITSNESEEVRKCTGWMYSTSQYKTSIVTEWNLVCDRKWLGSFSQSMHMVGCMVGSLLFGELSDRYGRRPVLLCCTVMMVGTGIGTAFLPSLELYTIFRFILGMAVAGLFNAGYVIAIELVGPKWRSVAGIMMLYFASFSIMVLSALAYLVRDWRHLQLVVSAPLALLLTYFLVAPESPRWLMVHKKFKGARKLIERLAKYNGKVLPQDYREWLNHEGETHCETGRRYSMVDLFRTKQIRHKSIILCSIWFVISITYYGLSMYTSNLGGNPYLNFFMSGAVELPAYTAGIWFLNKYGRRLPLVLSLLISGVFLLLTSLFGDDMPTVRIVLSMLGKMCITLAFVIIYPFCVEIFPTVIRNNGLGFASVGARIGGFVAPFILLLGDISAVLPLVVCGGMAFCGGFLALILPETHHQNLPETIEDAELAKIHSIPQMIRRLSSKFLSPSTVIESDVDSGSSHTSEEDTEVEQSLIEKDIEHAIVVPVPDDRRHSKDEIDKEEKVKFIL